MPPLEQTAGGSDLPTQGVADAAPPSGGAPENIAVAPTEANPTAPGTAPPLGQTANGSDANPPASLPGTQVTQASGAETTLSAGNPAAGTQVTTLGHLIVIQNGTANTIALPAGTSLDSLAAIIQNSVNDQIIRNITTMNITIEAQMLATQARLNGILNQALQGLR
jgi:hypothetical protein